MTARKALPVPEIKIVDVYLAEKIIAVTVKYDVPFHGAQKTRDQKLKLAVSIVKQAKKAKGTVASTRMLKAIKEILDLYEGETTVHRVIQGSSTKP